MSPDEGYHGDVLFVLGLAGKLAELKWYQNVRSLLTPSICPVANIIIRMATCTVHVQYYVYSYTALLQCSYLITVRCTVVQCTLCSQQGGKVVAGEAKAESVEGVRVHYT